MEIAALAVFICLIVFGFIFIVSTIYKKCFLKDFLFYGNVEEGQMDPSPPEVEIIQGIAIGWYDNSRRIYSRHSYHK